MAPRSQDPEVLTAQVRMALGRSIVQELYPGGAEMQVMSLDPQLERLLLQAVAGGGDGMPVSSPVLPTPWCARLLPRRNGRRRSACRWSCWFRGT
jgi:flagellar biosynthesis protein FlhA